MIFLFILLFLVGCGDSVEVVQNEPLVFSEIEIPEITFRNSLNYNGQIDFINDNSWVFTSHTNDLCIGKLNSSCRKVNASYNDELENDRVIKLSFEFNVVEVNLESDMYWNILYQDWVRIDPNDTNGNHPISTLKLKIFDGALNLCHYDNSWQWGYDFGDNRDGNAIDVDHSLHQENTMNGCKVLDVGVSYNIEIINYDYGRFVYMVNGVVISDKEYQTKSPTENHVIQWGQYWDKGYNKENNPLDRVVIRIDNLKLWVAHH